jgi:exodeoxyribonuclease VII small subunit
MAKTDKADKTEAVSFEASMTRLEEIVRLLENDKAPLEETLRLYEEGVSLVRTCSSELDRAEQKVQILQRSAEGAVEAVDFDAE